MFSVSGILKKWQLIFYGTQTSPIRLRTRPVLSTGVTRPTQAASQNFFLRENPEPSAPPPGFNNFAQFNQGFQNFANIFSVAGSDPVGSYLPLAGEGEQVVETKKTEENGTLKVLHICDPECDPQGCYGKGPTQCIACLHYKLDK